LIGATMSAFSPSISPTPYTQACVSTRLYCERAQLSTRLLLLHRLGSCGLLPRALSPFRLLLCLW
jgi:hypothetical protein